MVTTVEKVVRGAFVVVATQAARGIDPALTVKDVAALLNVDQKTIYRLAQRGEIPGFKVSGSWRFQRADMVNWIAKQKMITSKK